MGEGHLNVSYSFFLRGVGNLKKGGCNLKMTWWAAKVTSRILHLR